MIRQLVERHGATPVVAIASLPVLVPLAAWAGTVDLAPSAGTWIAGGLGLLLILPWFLFARHAYSIQGLLPPRARRFEWRQMSGPERGWLLGAFAGVTGVVGWLNAAATVDLGPLLAGVAAGRPGIIALGLGAAAFLALSVALAVYCWRRARDAYFQRGVT